MQAQNCMILFKNILYFSELIRFTLTLKVLVTTIDAQWKGMGM